MPPRLVSFRLGRGVLGGVLNVGILSDGFRIGGGRSLDGLGCAKRQRLRFQHLLLNLHFFLVEGCGAVCWRRADFLE